MFLKAVLFYYVIAVFNSITAHAHGRVLDPPSRQSAWRYGFPVPKNYVDHGMNCGRREIQWGKNGGKCGICGDSWSGQRFYERPNGLFVQHNIITKTYIQGETIKATIELTVSHLGWSEFRICDVAKSGGVEATQSCLNNTILSDKYGQTRFYFKSSKIGIYEYDLVLPKGMTCDHCVLQWKWKTGNSWGCDAQGCALGHGDAQEEFYGCSDVRILPRGVTPQQMSTSRPITRQPTVRPTKSSMRPSGKEYAVWTLVDIIRKFDLVSRTFDLSETDDDLDLDDVIPLNISGQDFLQMIVTLRNQAKLPFVN